MPDELIVFIKRIQTEFADIHGTLMEVCGTHTHAIRKAGIHRQLPPGVRLLSGPGCPVCVTGGGYIEQAVRLSRRPKVILATFGDLLKVPGPGGTLADARAEGSRIQVVYSPLDAVELARKNPAAEVIFLGVGFETTAPAVALAVREAERLGVVNFSVLPALKVLKPAMLGLLSGAALEIDGLIAPGHLSVVLGAKAFEHLPEQFGLPAVITGFRPEEVWLGIAALLRQIKNGEARLENRYPRVVSEQGNEAAQRLMAEVFAAEDAEWRGLGLVPGSGMGLAEAYRSYDAARKFGVEPVIAPEPPGCRCGEILLGRAEPEECAHFDRSCTPEHPVGPCMVSAEGTCAAHFYYRGLGGAK